MFDMKAIEVKTVNGNLVIKARRNKRKQRRRRTTP
jgi:hypothetical protein